LFFLLVELECYCVNLCQEDSVEHTQESALHLLLCRICVQDIRYLLFVRSVEYISEMVEVVGDVEMSHLDEQVLATLEILFCADAPHTRVKSNL
jgi:hypothetical protein